MAAFTDADEELTTIDEAEALVAGETADAAIEEAAPAVLGVAPGQSLEDAVAAAKQDYEWQFIELFFLNQDEAKKHGADQDFLNAIARGVGVVNFNVEQWQRDMQDDDIQATLEADEKITAERRLPAEPAVVVGGSNGTEELIQSPSLGDVQASIAEVR